MKRAITGTALVLVLGFAIIYSQLTLLIVLSLISIAGLYEFFNIVQTNESQPRKILASLLSVSILVTFSLFMSGILPFKFLLLNMILALIIFLRELFSNNSKPFTNIAFTVLGLIYVTLPLACLTWLGYYAGDSYNWHLILSFFAIVWIYDTFAFFTGMLIGKHRLFERISPKKSWEGAIGGLIFALLAAWGLSVVFIELNILSWILFATIVVVFATLGDLTESMLKRSYNLKDSGNLLPGHGGILDRFDSVFIAAPAIFIFLQFIKVI